jgi:hypothetical protein
MKKSIKAIKEWRRREVYNPGEIISRFIARDVKREVRVISIDQISEGVIVGQVRTNNVLYLSKGFVKEQDFGEPMTLEIDTLWDWSGQPWGGMPDGRSIVDHLMDEQDDG